LRHGRAAQPREGRQRGDDLPADVARRSGFVCLQTRKIDCLSV
jgi:hypothetical protein